MNGSPQPQARDQVRGFTELELRELAARGAAELDGASATELLGWTDETFGADGYLVASNMEDAVLIDLAAKVRPGVQVLFLDTDYHFPETLSIQDAVKLAYHSRLLNVTPEHTVAGQDAMLGKDCGPVTQTNVALRGYSAWVTGIRRVDGPTRTNAPTISFDEKFNVVKVNPLAAWSDQDMADYIAGNNVVVNPRGLHVDRLRLLHGEAGAGR